MIYIIYRIYILCNCLSNIVNIIDDIFMERKKSLNCLFSIIICVEDSMNLIFLRCIVRHDDEGYIIFPVCSSSSFILLFQHH